MIKRMLSVLSLTIFISACGHPPEQILPKYAARKNYNHYSCHDIKREMDNIEIRISVLYGKQDKKAINDKIAVGVGALLFWPALLYLFTDDEKKELAILKGHYQGLDASAMRKKCY